MCRSQRIKTDPTVQIRLSVASWFPLSLLKPSLSPTCKEPPTCPTASPAALLLCSPKCHLPAPPQRLLRLPAGVRFGIQGGAGAAITTDTAATSRAVVRRGAGGLSVLLQGLQLGQGDDVTALRPVPHGALCGGTVVVEARGVGVEELPPLVLTGALDADARGWVPHALARDQVGVHALSRAGLDDLHPLQPGEEPDSVSGGRGPASPSLCPLGTSADGCIRSPSASKARHPVPYTVRSLLVFPHHFQSPVWGEHNSVHNRNNIGFIKKLETRLPPTSPVSTPRTCAGVKVQQVGVGHTGWLGPTASGPGCCHHTAALSPRLERCMGSCGMWPHPLLQHPEDSCLQPPRVPAQMGAASLCLPQV